MIRKRAIRTIVEVTIFDTIIAILVSPVVSFPTMLALGALHSQWSYIPAFGWWTTYIILFTWILALRTVDAILPGNIAARIRAQKLS